MLSGGLKLNWIVASAPSNYFAITKENFHQLDLIFVFSLLFSLGRSSSNHLIQVSSMIPGVRYREVVTVDQVHKSEAFGLEADLMKQLS